MRRLACLAVAAFLAGCTATEVDEGLLGGEAWDVDGAAGVPAPDQPYFAALYEGYIALARSERAEFDWFDTAEFRSRALKAARGEPFGPVDPAERNLSDSARPEVEAAFAELSAFLANDGAILRAGRQIGEAQVKLDCWMQEIEEAHQIEEINACQMAYGALIVVIRELAKLPDTLVVVLPEEGGEPGGVELRQGGKTVALDRPFAAADAGDELGDFPVAEGEIRDTFSDALAARPKPPREFVITFAFDSAVIRDDNREVIRQAADDARGRAAPEVIVTGYADAPGTSADNLAISRQRARTVARAIEEALRGAENVRFMRSGRGERDLVVRTARPEEANRRVVILVR